VYLCAQKNSYLTIEPQRISLATSDGSSNPDAAAATATEPKGAGATEETEVWVPPSLVFGMCEWETKMVFEKHLRIWTCNGR
jgi:hypothetical protein